MRLEETDRKKRDFFDPANRSRPDPQPPDKIPVQRVLFVLEPENFKRPGNKVPFGKRKDGGRRKRRHTGHSP
jgi:hypothetical protein